MYKITKRLEVAGAHSLKLPYESKCQKMHGHNWIIEVEISGNELNDEGMLIDFTHIKNIVNQLDHQTINHVIPLTLNPTAENIAFWLTAVINDQLRTRWDPECKMRGPDRCPQWVSKVTVQESEGNTACFIP